MPITARRPDGKATSTYSEVQLYALVAEVARYVSPTRPETVSQRAFDRSRAGAGHPEAPSARAICMRLGSDGVSMSWDLLRRKALSDIDHDHSHARHRGSGIDSELGVKHLIFALRWTAREAGLKSITPSRYGSVRRDLLRRERRGNRSDHDHLLPDLLPTAGQIERIARDHDRGRDDAHAAEPDAEPEDQPDDEAETVAPEQAEEEQAEDQPKAEAEDPPEEQAEDPPEADAEDSKGESAGKTAWDLALELAGLEPRSSLAEAAATRRRERSRVDRRTRLPIEEAIHHFVEFNGELPSSDAIIEFARLSGFACEARSKPWGEHLEDAGAYRASLGLSTPEPRRRQANKQSIEFPEDGIPGAPPRRKGNTRHSEEDCIAALRRFDAETPPSEPRTQTRYLAFRTEHGLVPIRVFPRYGGFRALMKKAREG